MSETGVLEGKIAYEGRQFRITRVLTKSVSIFFRNFLLFNVVVVAVIVPLLIMLGVSTLVQQSYAPQSVPHVDAYLAVQIVSGAVLGSLVLIAILYPIAAAIIMHATFECMREVPARPLASIARGFARGFAVNLLCHTGLTGLVLAAYIGSVPIHFLMFQPDEYLLTALVLPAYLAVLWSAAIPACAVERLGPIASLRRSHQLTRGHRWHVAAIITAVGVPILLAATAAIVYVAQRSSVWHGVGVMVLLSVLSACVFVVLAVTYHELRHVKEGDEIETIAAVFD